MKTSAFLLHLKEKGIKVWTEEGKLKLSAKKGALTPELKTELGARKAEILAALTAAQAGKAELAAEEAREALVSIERGQPLPLSFAQQRLWFMQQLDPQLVAYNLPLTWSVRGELDVPLLERVLQKLVQRHESLRTIFVEAEGLPAQIAPEPAPYIPIEELPRPGDLDQTAWEAQIARAMTEFGEQPFDLATGPLLRFFTAARNAEHHILQLVVHHIVFDGISIAVFARELKELYDAEHDGLSSKLEPLQVHYADFASWQARHFEAGGLGDQLAFWRESLRGELPILELPTDWTRPAVQTFNGSKIYLSIEPELFQKLEATAKSERVTMYMLMLAAYKLLLHRYSGLEDVIVGTAVDGRPLPEVEETIGFFINTLALRTDLSGDPSFSELLARVRQTCLGSFEHKDLPFERLVDELQPERNLSYAPIFQALFFHELTRESSVGSDGLNLEPMERLEGYEFRTAKNDLALWIAHNESSMLCWLEYNRDLFSERRMEAMMQGYRTLLEAIVRDPSIKLSAVPLLNSQAEIELRETWNDTQAPFPQVPVHEQFEAWVDRNPCATALVFATPGAHSPTQTYLELDQAANRLANHCIALGLQPHSLVGLCLDRSAEMVVAQLAIQKCGAAYVPLDPSYPKDRLTYMVEHSGLEHVISNSGLAGALPDAAQRILLDRDRDAIQAASEQRPGLKLALRDRMYVIYTSGSTGLPKGVELEHHSVSNFLASMAQEPGFGPGMGLLAVTTLSFDISVLETMLPLVTGGHVIVAPREALTDGLLLAQCIDEEQPAMMQATPSTWRLLTLAGWQGDPRLRVLVGGEALPVDLAQQLVPLCSELWNMYGPTETTIWSTLKQITDGEARITIGRPIRNTQVYVLGADGQLVPPGVSAELWIAGDGLARGYLKRPDLTEQAFSAHPFEPGQRIYRTGDRARWTLDGELECLGRIDTQIKLRGFRIELGEIESVVASAEGVAQCVCLVREDTPGDQRLFAYYTVKDDAQVEGEVLRAAAHAKLPAYMVPASFVARGVLPQTPNGKVDKKALLKQKPVQDAEETRILRKPEGALQVELHGYWCETLKRKQVEVDGNFFDLGGHSLLLAQVHAKLRSGHPELGLSIIELFQYPTIEGLAAHTQAKAAGQGNAAPEKRERTLAKGRQALMRRRRPRA